MVKGTVLGPSVALVLDEARGHSPCMAAFAARIGPRLGFDLRCLKPAPLGRRLQAMLAEARLPTLNDFADWLESEPARLEAFTGHLTVHVSSFFRDAQAFHWLREDALPKLLATQATPMRVWSAGCAGGAELYSLAMLLEELGALKGAELLGTDLDRASLNRAASAVYPPEELREINPERLARHFQAAPMSDRPGHLGHHRVKDPLLRGACRWRVHNLLTDAPEGSFDLILCRNVAIYHSLEGQGLLFAKLAEALRPGGLLLVGRSERVPHAAALALTPVAPQAYRKGAEA